MFIANLSAPPVDDDGEAAAVPVAMPVEPVLLAVKVSVA